MRETWINPGLPIVVTFRPDRARRNPLSEFPYFLSGQSLFRWHPFTFVAGCYPRDQLAFVSPPRDDDFSGIATTKRKVPGIQSQSAFLFPVTVTGRAPLDQQRSDFPFKVGWLG